MNNVLERLDLGSRVGVVRLRSLGDCVLTTPALQILKSARPDLSIDVVVEDRFAALFRGNPDVDAVLPPDRRQLAERAPALCLNLHGGTRSHVLTLGCRAGIAAGFGHFRGSWLYSVRIPTAQEILGVDRKVHTAEHLASAMFYLGAPRCEIPRARLFAGPPPERRRPYAVIHPFAAAPEKTWTPAGFLAAAWHVQNECECDPVFIGGPSDPTEPFAAYDSVLGAPLEEVAALLGGASFFLGNDSGPAHMAAALGVPAVVLFGPSDAEIWGPWRAVAEVVQAEGHMDRIELQRVIEAMERVRQKVRV